MPNTHSVQQLKIASRNLKECKEILKTGKEMDAQMGSGKVFLDASS